MFSHAFILGFLDFIVPNLFLSSFYHSNQYWLSVCYEQSARFQEEDHEALKEFKEIAASYYPDFATKVCPKGHFDETCMDAVPLSFHIITLSSSFEDAIRLAISHGGDSDTFGVIIGSIAEARFGFPQEMEDKTISYLLDNMKDVLKIIACAWVCFLRENVSKYHSSILLCVSYLSVHSAKEWYFDTFFIKILFSYEHMLNGKSKKYLIWNLIDTKNTSRCKLYHKKRIIPYFLLIFSIN